VLLVMGFGMRGALWRPQVEALSARHRVATYDHLGVGGSDAPRRTPTIAQMAQDALRLLDELGWRSVHVVGVSMGGMISQELALAAPGRIRSLSLIATHAGGLYTCLPPAEGLMRFVQANASAPAGRVEALKRLLYTPEFLATADEASLDQRIADMVGRRAPRRVVQGQLLAVLRHRTAARLGQIRVPTLVVKPGRDILIAPGNSDRLARLIPGARLVSFDEAGHGLTFQSAEALNRELLGHIAGVELRRGGAGAASEPDGVTA
jgi:3-oxoadipate enol-lactonase